jgi:hypothetical protein
MCGERGVLLDVEIRCFRVCVHVALGIWSEVEHSVYHWTAPR